MSLLNKMLQDLDQRRAAPGERLALPGAVQSPSMLVRKGRPIWPLAALGIGFAALGAAGWLYWSSVRRAPLAPLPAAATPVALQAPADPAGAMALASVQAPKAPVASVARPPSASSPSPAPARAVPSAPFRRAAPAAASATASGLAKAPAAAPSRVEKVPAVTSVQYQAESEYRRGMTLLGQGAAAEAELALSEVLHLVPEHAQARQALFNLLLDQRRTGQARMLLDEGLRIMPGHISWAMNLARMQMEENDAASAWETLQRSLPLANASGEYQAFCGNVLQRLNRSQEAIPYFHKALRINPAEGRWWLGLGLALESSDHPAEAREAFIRAKSVGNLPPDLAVFANQKSR